MADLTPFDGRDVVAARVAVTRAGDGLSKALGVDPAEWHLGDVVTVVLECVVSRVRFEELPESDDLARVHTLRAGTATVVDTAAVHKAIAAQRRRIDEAAGRTPLFGDEGDDG